MAFWEELKEKFTQGSQDAIRKTTDVSDVVTLNAGISDSKRKITELQQEIGAMLMTEAFGEMTSAQITAAIEEGVAEEPRAVLVRNWKEIFEKASFGRSEEEVIEINENKIKELRSEAKCPGCGGKISKGMVFCPVCGTRLVEPAAEPEATSEPEATAEPAAASEPVAEAEAESVAAAEPEVVAEPVAEVSEPAATAEPEVAVEPEKAGSEE